MLQLLNVKIKDYGPPVFMLFAKDAPWGEGAARHFPWSLSDPTVPFKSFRWVPQPTSTRLFLVLFFNPEPCTLLGWGVQGFLASLMFSDLLPLHTFEPQHPLFGRGGM